MKEKISRKILQIKPIKEGKCKEMVKKNSSLFI